MIYSTVLSFALLLVASVSAEVHEVTVGDSAGDTMFSPEAIVRYMSDSLPCHFTDSINCFSLPRQVTKWSSPSNRRTTVRSSLHLLTPVVKKMEVSTPDCKLSLSHA